jgi:hypothetical protein
MIPPFRDLPGMPSPKEVRRRQISNGFNRRFTWPFFAAEVLGRSLYLNLIKGNSPRVDPLFGILCIFIGSEAVRFAQRTFPFLLAPLTAMCLAGLLYGGVFHLLRKTKDRAHQPDTFVARTVLWIGTGMMFILFTTALSWQFPWWYGASLYAVLFIRSMWKEFRHFIHPKRIWKILL